MVNWKSKKLGDFLLMANGLAIVILINILSADVFFRLDLTEEKRYSIKSSTREMLGNLDDQVFIEIYLEGDLNTSFKRFQKEIREILEEFRIYSDNRIQYTFINPELASSKKAQTEFMAALAEKGIQPTNVIDTRGGQRIEKIIFPGGLISYGSRELGLTLLKGNKANSSEEEINQSIEGLEFELANAIFKLSNDEPKRIGLLRGHGEPDSTRLISFENAIQDVYQSNYVTLDDNLKAFEVIVITKPSSAFSEIEKYRLDQYVMNGGKLLIMLDKLEATMDSTSRPDYFAFPYNLGLDDLLFKYGVRVNYDLVQDLTASRYPIVIGQSGDKPKIQLIDWPFFPLINRYAEHPITLNLDAVVTRFASTIDTVKAPGIKKTPLLFTSQQSRKVAAPVNVSIQSLRRDLAPAQFNQTQLPIAYLLEGKFTSLFRNRFVPEGEDASTFRTEGVNTKIVVIGDGDLALNVVNPRTGEPQRMGFDPFSNYTFANQDLLMNTLAYLTDENGLIRARNKEVKIRPLDKQKVNDERLFWQILNVGVPLLFVILYGVIRSYIRKKRFSSF
jgi:ABC-2 type transport system permease protein